MTAELDLAGLKAMLAEATAGEWAAHRVPGHPDLSQIVATMPDGSKACVSCDITDNDAPFVAAAKTAFPKLIQRIEELEEAVREADAALDANDRLLGSILKAIDTGRNEPLCIVRDLLVKRARTLTPNEGR